MTATQHPRVRSPEVFERALKARDARFDGVFFVGITSTGIYCRPVCPARVSHPEHRRFFNTAAAAERSGFRPCLRCRPELAPGRSRVDAVPRLADTAARRIEAGALNGRTVPELAEELSVSARHLRRALRQEVGVSPVELAQTHRLLMAKRLLADTSLAVGRVAHASGFQSLRRFNAVFRDRYQMSPTDVRRSVRRRGRSAAGSEDAAPPTAPAEDLVRLTLSYRPPFAWRSMLAVLGGATIEGIEMIEGGCYGRTVRIGDCAGVVFVDNVPSSGGNGRNGGGGTAGHLRLDVSVALLPVLMPLLVGLRQLFDLDAEPQVVDAHLREGGLARLVDRRPGLRLPGAIDGFEVAFRAVLANSGRWRSGARELTRRVTWELGERFETGIPALERLAPDASRVARCGARGLADLGVGARRAASLAEIAHRVADGTLCLNAGGNATAVRRQLLRIEGVGDRLATTIVMRALQWPDAFPFSDPSLALAAGAPDRRELRRRAAAWRPWRSYAALHLWLDHGEAERSR